MHALDISPCYRVEGYGLHNSPRWYHDSRPCFLGVLQGRCVFRAIVFIPSPLFSASRCQSHHPTDLTVLVASPHRRPLRVAMSKERAAVG
jgi:hypothetical protein